jgi:cell division septum initiation protein DivIVA
MDGGKALARATRHRCETSGEHKMDTHHDIELEQIEQDMARLIEDAEQAAEAVRSTLNSAVEARDQILAGAEGEAEQIRIAARGDGDEIRAEAQQDGAKIRTAANDDAAAVVAETRDRAAQMLETAQKHADRILDEARTLQLRIRASIPEIQRLLDDMGPVLADFASASEQAHLDVANAIESLKPASTGTGTESDEGDAPATPGSTY